MHKTAKLFYPMVHQGKILKRQIENKDLTHVQAAEILKLSRSGLSLLFKEVELSEKNLDKVVNLLGIPREIFFPQTTQSAPVQVPDSFCWQQLVAAQAKIIELQQQIIEMKTPNVNAPKRTQPA